MNKLSIVVTTIAFLLISTLSYANKVVEIPLGKAVNIEASISWQGEWADATPYLEGDAVQYDRSSYLCIQEHTSSPSDSPPHAYWDIMADGGAIGPKGETGHIGPLGLQGIQGLQGAKGDVGPTGETGPMGSQGIQGILGAKGNTGDTGPAGATPFGLNGSDTYYVDGKVGIGTMNPERPLHLSDAMRLEPVAAPPVSPASGDIYYDISDAICAYMAAGWVKIAGNGHCGDATANAGGDQSVLKKSLVTLDGSGSSGPNGDAFTYSWAITSKPSGSTSLLSDSSIVKPVFTADLAGTYIVSLIVNDGNMDSVSIIAANTPPVANAGVDQNAAINYLVTLDGNGSSDLNGDSLTYSWVLTPPAGSDAILSDDTAQQPTFTADHVGTYSAQLVVGDGTVASPADTVVVMVAWPDTVISQTGRIWMDRNLGASRVAISYNDELAYGDYYQWGRYNDGHEKKTSGTTETRSSTDDPGHGDFITSIDWRETRNNNLWQGVSGTNNPCPPGFRLPTESELSAELDQWGAGKLFDGFWSPLKIVMAGWRNNSTATITSVNSYAYLWTSTVRPNGDPYAFIVGSKYAFAETITAPRGDGKSVRCIMD